VPFAPRKSLKFDLCKIDLWSCLSRGAIGAAPASPHSKKKKKKKKKKNTAAILAERSTTETRSTKNKEEETPFCIIYFSVLCRAT
jgi:hypothetical protein